MLHRLATTMGNRGMQSHPQQGAMAGVILTASFPASPTTSTLLSTTWLSNWPSNIRDTISLANNQCQASSSCLLNSILLSSCLVSTSMVVIMAVSMAVSRRRPSIALKLCACRRIQMYSCLGKPYCSHYQHTQGLPNAYNANAMISLH